MRIQHFPHKHRKNANVRHKTKIATHLLNAVVITSKRYGMMNMNLSVTWLGCSSVAELMFGICEDMDQ